MGLPFPSCCSLQELLCAFQQPAINLLLSFHPGKMTGALHPQRQKIPTAEDSCPTNSLCAAAVPSTNHLFHHMHGTGRAVPVAMALASTWGSSGFLSRGNLAAPTAARILNTLSWGAGAGSAYDSP